MASSTATIGYGEVLRIGLTGRRSELLLQALEELTHQHLRDAAQHALADAGDGPADLTVPVNAHLCRAALLGQLDQGLAAYEAGAAGPLHQHLVAARLLL